jgi:hypothetical protein
MSPDPRVGLSAALTVVFGDATPTLPPPTLLLRRMEVQVLSLLGELHADGDWGAAMVAEYWARQPASTPLGRDDAAFFQR